MKKVSLFVMAALMPFVANAEEAASANLDLNVRRIGLEWSKTDVRNAQEYKDITPKLLLTH